MSLSRLLSIVLVIISLAATTGCGHRDRLNRQPISGTVLLDGTPLDQGTIEFAPRQEKRGVRSGATINAGKYAIPRDKGLPPGEYLVRIFSAQEQGVDGTQMPGPTEGKQQIVERIPAKYNIQSDLLVKVVEGGDNRFDFDVKTK